MVSCGVAWWEAADRSHYRGDRYLLRRQSRDTVCLGLWLRRMSGLPVAGSGLCALPRGMSYQVKEIYYTLQGEGAQTGRAAVFLRFAGCNLWTGLERDRASAVCQFCDTDFVGTDGVNGGKFTTANAL